MENEYLWATFSHCVCMQTKTCQQASFKGFHNNIFILLIIIMLSTNKSYHNYHIQQGCVFILVYEHFMIKIST